MFNKKVWTLVSIIFMIITVNTVISTKVNDQPTIKYKNVPSEIPFSMDSMFLQLMYSYTAYCIPEQIVNWTCPYCIYNSSVTPLLVTQLIDNDSTNTFGFIGITTDKKSIVISFRGTEMESLDNWITNLNFPKSEPYPGFPGALVHSGFNRAYRNVRNIVHSGLNFTLGVCPTCEKLIITGHSLGGALAIMAATDIYESQLTTLPLEMYTFGSPRVGDVAFAEYFESTVITNYWRIVYDHDLVPHLPPMQLNFYHLPTEVWFNNASDPSQHIVCNPTGEDPSCSDSLKVALNVFEHLAYFGISKDLC
ncbi:hypothetical protein DICPUDRAFT_154842 [Dictyostelium purpureum]|uniref:Fungal lipase-type domain-containing protein n=1 Tax=Dictyostelium purpureum TaxID=5786 RepID=F0ZSE8_DICPU|nr:uncharacterized protein DICPUDRAFT_154842 [Dictyostelium purpureum]EGC33148.1 hypothetical protein DICPUDRAFT_154842 [Dictyostelium purpureum]|eukprot:XP_003290343.1 hypothetical protein DICPUDRAFT_154842 [Dictyostelium purpureum]